MLKKTAVLSSRCIASWAVLALLGSLCACARKVSLEAKEYYVESTDWVHPPMVESRALTSTSRQTADKLSANTPIDEMLRAERLWKINEGILNGYTVQLYRGASRSRANELHKRANEIADTPTVLFYKQPHYILWTGFFAHPLLAYMQLRKLEDKFSQALVTPRRITVKDCEEMSSACP